MWCAYAYACACVCVCVCVCVLPCVIDLCPWCIQALAGRKDERQVPRVRVVRIHRPVVRTSACPLLCCGLLRAPCSLYLASARDVRGMGGTCLRTLRERTTHTPTGRESAPVRARLIPLHYFEHVCHTRKGTCLSINATHCLVNEMARLHDA